ncbi:hypothetical protein O3M35_009717 [Rhynocoris fuscipes]|uniref:Lipocalin/cytosolic fatty-acid binding domain-containing protein n=1 Tax=Rhynocoris fuscipes TaxID=488301 RepID=A0AAW1D9A9_9HEMI
MKEQILVVISLLAIVNAQMPGIGWCPDKRAMPGFDIDRYLGTWYEAERYFTVLEAGSRCARTNYTKAVDGRILVSNEITNRLTGIKRVLDGEIRNIPKGGVDSKISVKYSTLPFPVETEYIILDTDYDSYSVVWSCSGIGPLVNTQSAWVMTRDRLPPGTVLQKAYAVLDKHKISRTFFVRAEQEECNLGEALGGAQKTRSNSEPITQHVESPVGVLEPVVPVVTKPVENAPPALVPVAAEEQKKTEPVPSVTVSKEPSPVPSVVPEQSSAAEESPASESPDSVRKPAPAITAAPPVEQKPVESAENPSSSTSNTIAGASEQNKN